MFVKDTLQKIRYFDSMKNLLAARVKEAVTAAEDNGHSVAHIAKECGISRQAVYQWASGETKSIKGKNLVELADLSGYSARWIINGKGAKTTGLSKDEKIIVEAFRLLDAERMEEELETSRRRIEKHIQAGKQVA